MPISPIKLKKDFPIFKKNPGLKYLDSAATSLKPQCVIDAVSDYYSNYSANVHRGLYDLSEKATEAYENSRASAQKFINARSEREIIFTGGTTQAINLVAQSWGKHNLKSGDEILLTILEHHSNLVPWQMIAKEKNCVLKFLDIDGDGKLKIEQLSKLLTKKTKIVAVSHVSNALGTINPLKLIIQKAHAVSAKVLVDAAQSAPHMPLDVQYLDCDFLALSGHKMCGPTGIGILYAKEKILEEMPPVTFGGNMIREVRKTYAKWNSLPWKFEAGTPAIAEAIGFGKALEYLQKINMKNIREHEKRLLKYATSSLRKIPGVKLYGPCDPENQSGVLSFTLQGVHPHDIAFILNEDNIAVRAGHHCCMPLLERLGVSATVRLSFYIYNTEKDIDQLCEALSKIRILFNVVSLRSPAKRG